jgi:hypothetical protein
MNWFATGALLIAVLLLGAMMGCFQTLDPAPWTRKEVQSSGGVSGGVGDAGDPCTVTSTQALAILTTDCAGCHQAPFLNGNFDFVLDTQRLLTTASSTGVMFVVAGDPNNSRIYQRISVSKDMPPIGIDPRPTSNDTDVIRAWITNCLVATPDLSGQGGSNGTGGTGATGTGGQGGSSGTGGTA